MDTPLNVMPSLDQVVMQWMSPSWMLGGRAWISSHVQALGVWARPSTRNDQSAVSSLGVTSALSTGHELPASYCPGGSRVSRGRRGPANVRVNRLTIQAPTDSSRWLLRQLLASSTLSPCSSRPPRPPSLGHALESAVLYSGATAVVVQPRVPSLPARNSMAPLMAAWAALVSRRAFSITKSWTMPW